MSKVINKLNTTNQLSTSFKGYNVKKKIGIGAFSDVYKVQDAFTHKNYAAKVIPIEYFDEIDILLKASHSNIIKMRETFSLTNSKDEEFIVLILEYCKYGTLQDYLCEEGFINEREKRTIFKKILEAVVYLNEIGIAHCDIKVNNILIDENKNPNICDFNLSKFTDDKKSKHCGGTKEYTAPEVFHYLEIDDFTKVDTWCIGVTFYFASELSFPYDVEDLRNGKNFEVKTKNNELSLLLQKCFIYDPKQRITTNEMLNDNYFMIDDIEVEVNEIETKDTVNKIITNFIISQSFLYVSNERRKNRNKNVKPKYANKKLKNQKRRKNRKNAEEIKSSTDSENFY